MTSCRPRQPGTSTIVVQRYWKVARHRLRLTLYSAGTTTFSSTFFSEIGLALSSVHVVNLAMTSGLASSVLSVAALSRFHHLIRYSWHMSSSIPLGAKNQRVRPHGRKYDSTAFSEIELHSHLKPFAQSSYLVLGEDIEKTLENQEVSVDNFLCLKSLIARLFEKYSWKLVFLLNVLAS